MLSDFARNYRDSGGERDFDGYWSRAYGNIS